MYIALEWIPKWQNRIDAWFSGGVFAEIWPEKVQFSITDKIDNWIWEKLKYKITRFSSMDLDKKGQKIKIKDKNKYIS